ncbi:MAG TPA: FAD-dependent oxidoreductase [bacterium]|nr:FAD-dependent oxidoreductase [bacterium]
MTKEKRLYLPSESEDFQATIRARQVEQDVYFSTDPRDLGWIAENIPCQAACPALTNVPGYIRTIFEERYGRSYELNRFVNLLPGVLGRICSRPCEPACRHGWEGNGEPVAICRLKRSAADLKPLGHRITEEMFGPSGKSVAVVGSGPAGLGAAHDLAILGHKVVMFESLAEPGGMLRYGIPAFRLPRDVLATEIGNLLRLGVDLHCNTRVGKDVDIEDLMKQHDAVILAAGTLKPNRIKMPGAGLPGVYTGLEFMMRVNAGEKIAVGDVVHVIGGGYTAMDCARTAMRLGARRAIINVLGTEDFLQVEKHELFEVKLERGEVRGLVSIQAVLGKDRVEGVRFKRNRLGGFLPNGERDGIPIEGSDFEEPAGAVILAIGQQPDAEFIGAGVNKSERGRPTADPKTFMTSRPGLFLAGDFMTGAATIIKAIASGRRTAWKADEYMMGRQRKKLVTRHEKAGILRERSWDFIARQEAPTLKPAERGQGDGFGEVEQGYDSAPAREESKRCYLCYLKFEIDVGRCIYCRWCIDVAPKDCIKLARGVKFKEDGSYAGIEATEDWREVAAIAIDNKECIRCGACLKICPVQCIDVVKVELIEQPVAERPRR